MRCQQCPKPAFYQVGNANIPLCIDCNAKLQNTQFLQFLMNASMANQAADDMDMIVGFSVGGGRIPVAALAKALSSGPMSNHINITNSNIGVLNTGHFAKINAAVEIAKATDAEPVTNEIVKLTNLLLETKEIALTEKKELIDLIEAISTEVVGQRKKSVLLSLINALEDRSKGVAAIYGAAQIVGSVVRGLFGSI